MSALGVMSSRLAPFIVKRLPKKADAPTAFPKEAIRAAL